MATSSITGGEYAPEQADGKDIDLLGPSDSSDSGSDVSAGARHSGEGVLPGSGRSDTDRAGTGERGSVDMTSGEPGADILPDRVVDNPDGDDDVDEDLDADADAPPKPDALNPSEASDLADEQGPAIDA